MPCKTVLDTKTTKVTKHTKTLSGLWFLSGLGEFAVLVSWPSCYFAALKSIAA